MAIRRETGQCWRGKCTRSDVLSSDPRTQGLCTVCVWRGFYVGRAGQYRLPAKSGLPDRFWLHLKIGMALAALGVLGAVIIRLGYPVGWAVTAAHAVAVALFMLYEVTETADINDQAYRDIGGFQVGFIGAWAVAGVALLGSVWL